MLLACVRAGWNVGHVPAPVAPAAATRATAVGRATGVERPRIGVDGCGVPVQGMPLRAIATLYARLGEPERWAGLETDAGRAVDAMLAEPYLVGGRGRVDTAMMQAVPGVVAKEGAEALHCASVPSMGIGVAVKVADGGYGPPARR